MEPREKSVFWSRLRGRFPSHDVPFLPDADQESSSQQRHLALVLAYNGEDFAGWQVQPGARTVQGALEDALGQLCAKSVRVVASGRTDAGVHAWGQVASLVTDSRLDCPKMLAGLRALLPPEVYPRDLGPVPPGFNARYAAKAKTYVYFVWPQAGADIFLQGRLWPLEQNLSEPALREALELLQGEHDLAALASAAEVKGSTVRRILQADLEIEPQGIWRLSFTASGFLRHAVRNLVGMLVQVGQGRLEPSDLAEMLAAGQRIYPGPKAPPGGLYLSKVYYRDFEPMGG
ncbi:MAG: tRNA pseudouridine(38-40) synthase TruA [Desulfarculaceae bacterium]|jgi:tRNA pseudouridine38-40 synthase